MYAPVDKRQRRQTAYRERSRSSRLYARLLMPVAAIAMSVGIWSDPVWGPQMAEGLEEIKPVMATYLTGTPFEPVLTSLEQYLGPVEVQEADTNASGEQDVRVEANLLSEIRPVTRP